jgi:hypothetical protein
MNIKNGGLTVLAWLVLLVPAKALAWTALAYSPGHDVSYLYYMAKSAAEAEKEALAGCERAADGCRLLGETRDGPLATMVVNGKRSVARGSDANPHQALQQAMQECQRHDAGCRLVSAAWDRGTHIMAVTIDRENAWVGPRLPVEAQAREGALAICREASRSPETCTLFHVLNGPGWVTIARGPNTTGIGLSVRSSELAVRNALAECASVKDGASVSCEDIVTYHNPAGAPEPASYRELAQRIHADRRAMTASVPPFLGHPAP